MESRPKGRLFVSKMQPLLLFECAGGAVEFGALSPPLRGPYLFCLGRKDMEEKTAGDEIALTRRKGILILRAVHR